MKTSWRHVLKTSWRHVLKTSWRRLQRNNFSSSKTFSRRLQDVFARRLQDVLEDEKLLRWKRLEDVFKVNKCLLGRDIFYVIFLQVLTKKKQSTTHWVNICSWNIRGTFPWGIPNKSGKNSRWNSGEYSELTLREYWI